MSVDAGGPISNHLPLLKQRGQIELVGSKVSSTILRYLVAAPAATSYALTFTDANGNPVVLGSTSYQVFCHAEGTIVEVDESTKTETGVTILSKDYAGSATNFLNSINIVIFGRLDTQPTVALAAT